MASRPTNDRPIPLTVHAAVAAVTSALLAIVRLVFGRRSVFAKVRARESEDALAEERRAHLFGTGYPHAPSAK
jgi:hypothetical protein